MLRAVLGTPQRLLRDGVASRRLVLVVVFVALLLDNMLLTVVGTCGGLSAEGSLAWVPSGQYIPCSISAVSAGEFLLHVQKHTEVAGDWRNLREMEFATNLMAK